MRWKAPFRFCWNKFIVVVPSIAIREDVNKSFAMLEDHFMENYGKKARYFSTTLTRRTTATILKKILPSKLAMFRNNPEEFIKNVSRIVEHIQYDRIDQTYDSEIFTQEKHSQNVSKSYSSKKHIMDYVFTDSAGERTFAEDLDAAIEVCVYAKLPRSFQIPTPVGNYAPDWAIAFNQGAVKHIFFIAETKGSMDSLSNKLRLVVQRSCSIIYQLQMSDTTRWIATRRCWML